MMTPPEHIVRSGEQWVIPHTWTHRGTATVTEAWVFERFGVRDPRLVDPDRLADALDADEVVS